MENRQNTHWCGRADFDGEKFSALEQTRFASGSILSSS